MNIQHKLALEVELQDNYLNIISERLLRFHPISSRIYKNSSRNFKQPKENIEKLPETPKKPSQQQHQFQENNKSLQSSLEVFNSFTTKQSVPKNFSRYFGDKRSNISEKKEDTDPEANKVYEQAEDKIKLKLEISTSINAQDFPETRKSVDVNGSIDVSSSTQHSLESDQGIDNSTDLNDEIDTVANSSELNIQGDNEASENLRRLNEISKNLRMGNFTENDMIKVADYKKEVLELINHFRDIKFYKKELLSLTKTLKVLKEVNSIVTSNDMTESLQSIEKLRRTHPEQSIYKMAIELDESIKKVIKEYQIKSIV
ncbi:uncharacterized protein [Chironomus tepperi]|uniref:uncharacterized protein n=1 Tax=Chironomus tepperi TaxID=113505 RepID=UPI00391F0536